MSSFKKENYMNIQKSKVVIIGAGNVGVSTAFCLINQGLCDEIALIDLNQEKAFGEVLDLSQSMEYMNRNTAVKVGTYDDCRDASIVIITASVPVHNARNDRLKMLEPTKKVMRTIVTEIMKSGFDGHLIVVSNPVDVMTYYAYKISGLPARQVIGSGTTLDTARLKYFIAQKIDVDPRSVHALVIGEHGDSEMIPWSTVRIGGKDIYSVVRDNEARIGKDPYDEMKAETIKAGWEIFNRKGNTCYGIASSTVGIVKTILHNENRILPVSTLLQGEYGHDDLYISVPTIIDRTGAKEIVELDMTDEEFKEFNQSCEHLKSFYECLDD